MDSGEEYVCEIDAIDLHYTEDARYEGELILSFTSNEAAASIGKMPKDQLTVDVKNITYLQVADAK